MYKVLYYYSSPQFTLVEIKRLDLSDGAPKDQVYYWLKIAEETGQVQKLTFQSMDESSRTFAEGSLELSGVFVEGTETVALKKHETLILNQNLNELIIHFLRRK